jgi:hypothetical protein
VKAATPSAGRSASSAPTRSGTDQAAGQAASRTASP